MADRPIDELYVSLGLDISEFERDFAVADRKWQQAASKLSSNTRMAKLKMEVDMAGFDKADKSIAALNARLKGLNAVYNDQFKVMRVTQQTWQEAVRKYGAAAKESQRLEMRYLREKKALRELETQMRSVNRARVDNKAAMLDEIMAFAGRWTLPAVAASAAAAIAQVGKASIQMAVDAVESENLFAEALGSSAGKARAWSKEISDALGLNDVAVRKSLGTFFVMLNSMGMTREKALEMSEAMTALANDMASFYNLDTEAAFVKLRAGIVGETEPLKQLGIMVDEATVKAYAYSTGIAKMGQELNQQQKVLARFAAIMDQTAQAQGDLARTAESPANMMRRLRADTERLEILLGERLLPAYNKLLEIALRFTGAEVKRGNDGIIAQLEEIAIKAAAAGPALFGMYERWKKAQEDSVPRWNEELKTYISRADRAQQIAAKLNQETGKAADQKDIDYQLNLEFDAGFAEAQRRRVAAEAKKTADALARGEADANEKRRVETQKINDDIFKISHSTFENEMMDVMRRVEEYRKAGAEQIDIMNWIAAKETEARRVQLETQRKMIIDVYGTSLDQRLLQIEAEAQAYRKAGFTELQTREMIEKQKLRAVKDYARQTGDAIRSALTGGWGDVISAVREALAAGKDGYEAMEKALEVQRKNLENESKAIDMVGRRVGLSELERRLARPEAPTAGLDRAREQLYGPDYRDSMQRIVQELVVVGNKITQREVSPQKPPAQDINLSVKVDVAGGTIDDTQTAERVANVIIRRLGPVLGDDNYSL